MVVSKSHQPDPEPKPRPDGESGGSANNAQSRAASSDDTEEQEFRQYQQFLRFQEWQRNEQAQAPSTGAARKHKWRRLLRFKLVRRALLLMLVLILGYIAILYYFPGDDGSSNTGGVDNPALGRRSLPHTPKDTTLALYNAVSAGDGQLACILFNDAAARTFAVNHNAANCESAVRRLSNEVRDPSGYANAGFGPGAITMAGAQAQVFSCAMKVENGPRLGAFALQRQPNAGWIIVGHERENCGTR